LVLEKQIADILLHPHASRDIDIAIPSVLLHVSLSVCLSVRPSHTDRVKTAKHIIEILSP